MTINQLENSEILASRRLKLLPSTMANISLMPFDFFVVMMRDWLDMNGISLLDISMSDKTGRDTLIRALRSKAMCFIGSKNEDDTIGAGYLQWLSRRGVGLMYLTVEEKVPSDLAFSVARNSPKLKCLHVNFSLDNDKYLHELEKYCPDLEEVMLRYTDVVTYMKEGSVVVKLCYDGLHNCIFCERARVNKNNWNRDDLTSEKNNDFCWRRFLYSRGLFKATLHYRTVIATLLIESGECNINAQRHDGYTALLYAAACGNVEIAELILQKDSSGINQQSLTWQRTPLMISVYYEQMDVIALLIEYDADRSLKDSDGKTAMEYAFAKKNRFLFNDDHTYHRQHHQQHQHHYHYHQHQQHHHDYLHYLHHNRN